jgi:hypothetical protein
MLDRRAFLAASAAAVAAPALAAIPAPLIDDAIWINKILREEGYLHLSAATYTLRSPIQIIGSKLMMDEGSKIHVMDECWDAAVNRETKGIIQLSNGGSFWTKKIKFNRLA